MKNIFADLYNKVVNFFYKTDNDAANAKDVACSRLKLVLMQDRTNLPPIVMDRMKRELIELLSKYVELDQELLDLNFEQEDEQMALMLSIPVIRAKNDAEIQEIIKKETLEKQRLEDLSIALGEIDETEKVLSDKNSDSSNGTPEEVEAHTKEKAAAADEDEDKQKPQEEQEDEQESIQKIEDNKTEQGNDAAVHDAENREKSENNENLNFDLLSSSEEKEKEKEKAKRSKSTSSKTKAISVQTDGK